MMSLPPQLLALYPPAPDTFAERPWWVSVDVIVRDGVAYSYRRMDGRLFLQVGDPASMDDLRAVDTAHPISFPGLRVGQVWACTYQTVPDVDVFMLTEYDQSRDRDPLDGEVRAWHVGSHWMRESALLALCRGGDGLQGAFLLADPTCPHLAPWAPPIPLSPLTRLL